MASTIAATAAEYQTDTFKTKGGKAVVITAIKHASLRIQYAGCEIQVDPVAEFSPVTDYSKFPKADVILVTHEHFDHICGLNQIRKSFGCKVIAQAECSKNIQNSKKNLSAYANTLMCLTGESHKKPVSPFICESADLTFNDNFSFEWEGNTVCIFSTPGHSPGSACISIKNMLFSGDTILQSKPIYRLPGGDRAKYKSITIPKIHEILNRETIVYPGHGTIIPATSIAWL